MRPAAVLLPAALAVLVGLPLVLRRQVATPPRDVPRVIVVTPHNEQIRAEFARGFDAWHRRRYGQPAQVVWNTPGGTNEISRMLVSSWEAALRAGRPPGGDSDLLFGGGSYEFDRLREPVKVTVTVDGAPQVREATVLEPIPFDQAWLDEVYGANDVGGRPLYDPGRMWFGAALSGFGIVWNQRILDRLGVAAPSTWADLADPALAGWVAMVNPAQSSSIATAIEAILQREGWLGGWRILRRCGANARSFSAASSRVPIEVSQGEAAAGICIDFFGRFQAQAMTVADRAAGDTGVPRLGYVDPRRRTVIDADPVAMLRNAPNPETARRFVEFVLSDEGQLLWQLPVGAPGGPSEFELRRMPIRRDVIRSRMGDFVDRVDPFEIAQRPENPPPSARDFVAPTFVSMVMDNHELLAAAWARIRMHPAYPAGRAVVTAADVTDPQLKRWLEAFDALPRIPGPEGRMLDLADPAQLREISAGWIKGGWKDAGVWPAGEKGSEQLRLLLRRFFEERYRSILEGAA